MRSRSNFQALHQILLTVLLCVSSACIDPNGNLNLVTGATSNSLTSETNDNQVETIGASGSDVISDESIPTQTGVDAAGEPITMPVTIAKLDSEFLIKATYIRGEAVIDTESGDYEAALWSWLHGTAIAAEDAKLMVYGAKGCVSPYAKLSVSMTANAVESYDSQDESADSESVADDEVIYTDASDVESGAADAIVLEADADGAFEFTVPESWVKHEMLVKHLNVPEGEESNAVGVVVGKTGDYSAIITSRLDKIDASARLMVFNNQIFFDKFFQKTGDVLLLSCNLDGYNCQRIARTKSSLDQKIYFAPKDTDPFMIGVDGEYNVLKIDKTGISRLNNKVFDNPDSVTFLNIVAPIGGSFALQTVTLKKSPFRMKLIPLSSGEAKDIGLIVDEFKDSLGQSLAWTAASAFHSLNIYSNEINADASKLTVDGKAASKSLTVDINESPATKTEEAKDAKSDLDSKEVRSVLYQVEMQKVIEDYNQSVASAVKMEDNRILNPEKIHEFKRACHSLAANHMDFAKNFVMAFICENDNGINQLVLSNGEKAVFVTNYKDTPVVGIPTLSKNGTFVAYTVQFSETSSALAVMHIPSGTQSLVMKQNSLENVKMINPKFARNRPTVLTYLVERTGLVETRQVGVIDLMHHKTFGSHLTSNADNNETADMSSEDENLDHVFGEDSEYPRADVDTESAQ